MVLYNDQHDQAGRPTHYQEGALVWPLVASQGWLLLDFGTNWCGHCRAAQAPLTQVLGELPWLEHIKEEDGRGRAAGRYFHVKLWPTLILLHDGYEVARLVRPTTAASIRDLLTGVAKVPL